MSGYINRKMPKLLLFDLDDTLLRTDKTISPGTLEALKACRERGCLIGICTSRAEHNCLSFLPELRPDLLIASGGAVVKYRGEYLFTAEFTQQELRAMIGLAREICGADCEITIDTLEAHYWNYKVDPSKADATWGDTVWTDFSDWTGRGLKFCVEIFEEARAGELARRLPDCDCLRFSGSAWYKFTRKDATKENAIRKACGLCGIGPEDVTSFGDDIPDIGMLKLCGTGIAMGNALPEVKEAADLIIGSCDGDGIGEYLKNLIQ